jgi:hypothetical protein
MTVPEVCLKCRANRCMVIIESVCRLVLEGCTTSCRGPGCDSTHGPDVDVAGLHVHGRQQHVVGVTYDTSMAQVHYLDPQMQQLTQALHNAVPHPC